MDEQLGHSEKVGAEENSTKIETDGVTTEEKLFESIMKGFARRNLERHAMLAEMEEEYQDVVCVDDITEKELKFLLELRVYEKVDEREAIAQYQLTPVDTKKIDTEKAFKGSPCKSNQGLFRENSRVTIDQISLQGLLLWKR